ncbi:MAG: FxsA family protein [Kangiellaceae bacterium]|nr:FxsA family protein [Kangiellaceae bacterium]MCW9000973.1 FxsA family protein [Kangiellaceae bacterium]
MRFLFLLFILMPIVEIGVFIQVGDIVGLGPTLLMVLATAIIGVNLLKRQGLRTWQEIQTQLAQGQVPAMAMASAAQLLFAGGLLLTPGFVTDTIGFALLVPAVRHAVAHQLIKNWTHKATKVHQGGFYHQSYSGRADETHAQEPFSQQKSSRDNNRVNSGDVIEGEFEDHTR